MKKLISISAIFYFSMNFAQNKFDGIYIAFEKKCWSSTKKDSCINYDNNEPKRKWFHKNVLQIKNDSVFLNQSPVSILNSKLSFSTSDGDFYYYKGKFSNENSLIKISLNESSCDYCPELVQIQKDGTYIRVKREKYLEGKLIKNGFILNGLIYKKANKKEVIQK